MSLIDYKELICKLRIAGMTEGNCELLLNAADVIEKLARDINVLTKERDAAAHSSSAQKTSYVRRAVSREKSRPKGNGRHYTTDNLFYIIEQYERIKRR